ncbi:MAG: class I SAM-dependent methyltransferase [Chitinophagaceae bacterium]
MAKAVTKCGTYSMDTKNIIEFYDNLVPAQYRSGINVRIYKLFKKLLHFGLKPDSRILELGSGIGNMTFLLSKYVKKGRIEAVDISPKSVQFSQQRIRKPNITFFSNDIVNHKPLIENIDFITLFDVIEHIPIDKHNELFHNISTFCNEHARVLINIPNPAYLEYDIENHPETLQIIDQPIPLKFILKNLENNDLSLLHFETYSIWVENDYQFLIITKKSHFKKIKLREKRTLLQKVIMKMERTYIKIKYNYR